MIAPLPHGRHVHHTKEGSTVQVDTGIPNRNRVKVLLIEHNGNELTLRLWYTNQWQYAQPAIFMVANDLYTPTTTFNYERQHKLDIL